MSKKIKTSKISIDISGHSVRIIQTDKAGKIVKAGSAPVSGEDFISDAIKNAADSAQIKGGRCVLVTGGSHIIAQRFAFPEMPPEALLANAEHEIESYLPGEPNNYAIDYRILPGGQKNIDLLAAALDKFTGAQLVSAAASAGFSAERIDTRENARGKLMEINGFNKSFAVLDASDYPANITVFIGGKFYVERYFSLNADAEQSGLDIENLAEEVASVIEYIKYRERDSDIEYILLYCGKKSSADILRTLSGGLDIPVVYAEENFKALDASDKNNEGTAYYLDAYGASINCRADLNLKPGKKERYIFKIIKPALCLFLIISGLLAAGIYLPYAELEALKAEERSADEELARYALPVFMDSLESEIRHMNKIIAEYTDFFAAPDAGLVLETIFNALPQGANIRGIYASGGEINITGTAADLTDTADYTEALRTGGLFAGVSVQIALSSESEIIFGITLVSAGDKYK